MPLSPATVAIIKSGNSINLPQFLNYITNNEIKDFWNWFTNNAGQYSAVATSSLIKGAKYKAGNCFDNAQYNALKFGLDYCEGFYYLESEDSFVSHGFNILNGEVIDFTVIKNIKNGMYHEQKPPVLYYGVIIPVEFIKTNFNEENVPIDNPLLVNYFKHTKIS